MIQKSRMISFRLSPDEYTRLCKACSLAGINNVSEFARAAMSRVIDSPDIGEAAADAQVQILRQKLTSLSIELDQLTRKIAGRNTAVNEVFAANGSA